MDLPLGPPVALLEVLTLPGYGLELADRIRLRSGGRAHLRPGSLYPALRALERRRLVRSRPARRPTGPGRPGRYYELTPLGVAVAAAQREMVASFFGRGAGLVGDAGLGPIAAFGPDAGDRPSSAEVDRMRARLLRCARTSDFVLGLRQSTAAAKRRPR